MTEYTCDSFRFFNLFPVYFGGKGTATFQCALARFELRIYLIDASVNQIDMRWSVYLLFVYFIRHHTQSQD